MGEIVLLHTQKNSGRSMSALNSSILTKCFKSSRFQKMSITKNMPLSWYSSMKKNIRKIRTNFDMESWLWKSEIGIFRSLNFVDLPRIFLMKCAIFHPMKLQFDAEAAEKFLKVI